jgi:UDP-N-acetylmuramyl pentapeptide phosphotransferase/UDP-N-acetylglucosamine-1-phosphate transferase
VFPVLIKILQQWKLYDSPGEHKIHSDFIPSLGGVAIMLGSIFALLMSLSLKEWVEAKYFFISLALMFLIGLRDDVLALTPRQKLYSQFLPVFLMVFLAQVTLRSTYGLIDLPFVPLWIIWMLSVFTLVILTNAYNLIDGLDGLAGTIGIIALTFFGLWFYSIEKMSLSLIAMTFAGALLAFLFFNWQPSKIFMGDTGALMIGFLLSFMAIEFINQNYELPQGHASRFQASVSTAIAVVIIPVFDTLRVIILRLRKFQSPFRADRNHLHHQFLNLGFSHSKAVLILGFINIGFILLAWALRSQSDKLILPLIALICLAINFILKRAQLARTK